MDRKITNAEQAPMIFAYGDYVDYLAAWTEFKKRQNPRWSLSVLSRQLKLTGSGSMNNVLSRKRQLSYELAQEVAKIIDLSDYQRDYWLTMVQLSGSRENKLLSLELHKRLGEIRPLKEFKEIDLEVFKQIANPLLYALRETVNLADFQENLPWIRARLAPMFAVSTDEIKVCIESLLQLGLLRRDTSGKLTQGQQVHSTPAEMRDLSVQQYHMAAGKLAIQSINEIDPQFRHFTATTMSLMNKDLPLLKQMIEEFCRKSLNNFDSASGDEVYQMNLQLFPLSRRKSDDA